MLLTRRFLQNLILARGVTATLIFDVEIRFYIYSSDHTFYIQNISVLPGQVWVLRVGGPAGQVEALVLPAGAVAAQQGTVNSGNYGEEGKCLIAHSRVTRLGHHVTIIISLCLSKVIDL